MATVPTIDELKLLIGVLSQFAPDGQSFPSPDHGKLVELLGFANRNTSRGKWFRLVNKVKNGDFGDMGALIAQEPASPKKRAVVEIPMNGTNEPGSSPTKKAKGVGKAGKGKGKTKAIKAEIDSDDGNDDEH